MKLNHKIVIFLLLTASMLTANQDFDLAGWPGNFSAVSPNAFDSFAYKIAAGDVNGDGYDDIIAGAYYADPQQQNAAGAVYIFYGSDLPFQEVEINLSLENADVRIIGAYSNDQCGKNVASGNLNNDAFDDIIISSPFADLDEMESVGKVYVIYGSNNLQPEYSLLNEEYDIVINGENPNDLLGLSLHSADINNDQFAELIIGSPNADHAAAVNCGKTYIIFGGNSLASEYNLALSEQDITIIGEEMNDNSSAAVTTGNFNNDDYLDLLIGAPQADPFDRINAGKIYLIKGVSDFTESEIMLSGSDDLTTAIYGASLEGRIGKTLALDDINNDGNDDLIFSDLSANSFTGAVEVIFGNVTLPEVIDLQTTSPNLTISGNQSGGRIGEKVFSGRINEDDISDIVIAVPSANTINGDQSGIIFIVYGSELITDMDLSQDPPQITITGASPGDKAGTSFEILNFNSDEINDFCIGAPEAGGNKGKFYTVYGDLPYLWNPSPANGQGDVDIDQPVTFMLSDNIEGVDINTVNINIAGTSYDMESPEFSLAGSPLQYSITVLPAQPFDYSQIVDVTVNCSDLAGWQMPEVSYAFFTQEDSDPPYTSLWIPEPDAMGVPIDTQISFHVYDDGQGVELNSVVVNVDGINYYNGYPGFNYSGDPNDYQITITPENVFAYNQLVGVMINASDLGETPNAMSPFSYSFTCGQDMINPYIILWDPVDNEEIARNRYLKVLVADDETGVDVSSIQFFLDADDLTAGSEITPITNGYMIYYQPQEADYYSYGLHTMTLICSDNALNPNQIEATSDFFCIEDAEPPYTLNHYPPRYADEVATNTHFSVDIIDDILGVDINSISITINSEEIMESPATDVTTIEGGFNIFYLPPERLTGVVQVIINATDLESPPHIMPADSYTFTCTFDEDPPYLENPDPAPNSQDISISTNIYLEVHDDKTGINDSTIVLLLNGDDVTVNCNITPLQTGFSILYDPPENFDFISTNFINISCYDNAIEPNLFNQIYQFTVENDIQPPYVINQEPAPGVNLVDLDTDIYLEVIDDGTGVNEFSLQMMVNSVTVYPEISPLEDNGYALFYDPPEDFEYSDIVTVTVFANDNAIPYNALTNYSYTFYCLDDDAEPPFLSGLNPSSGASEVPVETSISFNILDAESGVDINSLIFKVDNIVITNYNYSEVEFSDTTGYHIHYTPDPFNYGQTVFIQIYCVDLSSNFNEMLENYSFVCELDESPPEIVELFPEPGSSGYPNTFFYFKFFDEKSGIDVSSVYLEVNNEPVNESFLNLEQPDLSILELSYQPVSYLEIADDLEIFIRLDDLVGNRCDSTYTLNITDDDYDPYVLPIDPLPHSFTLPLESSLQVDVLDKGMGINLSSLQLIINGYEVSNYNISTNPYGLDPDSLGYSVFYNFGENYYPGQYINVRINVSDMAFNPNSIEHAYYFHLKEELKQESVKAIPDIVTPNGDGYNDNCRLWIETDKNLGDLSARIFNRQGDLVQELNIYQLEADTFYADWNGFYEQTKTAPAGLYIFQVKIGSNTIQGSIVLAR